MSNIENDSLSFDEMQKLFPEDKFNLHLDDAKQFLQESKEHWCAEYICEVNKILTENNLTEQQFNNYINELDEKDLENYFNSWDDDLYDCGCCTCCGCSCGEDEYF